MPSLSARLHIADGDIVLEVHERLAAAAVGADRSGWSAPGDGGRRTGCGTSSPGTGSACGPRPRVRALNHATLGIETAVGGTGHKDRKGRGIGKEGLQRAVPTEPPARLAEEMNGGGPSAGHGDAIARDLPCGASAEGRYLDRLHAEPAENPRDRMSEENRVTVPVLVPVRPDIHQRGNLNAAGGEITGRRVGRIVPGEQDHTPARRHTVAVHVRTHGTRQHHPRTVVAREQQRPLVRTGGQHHPPGPDMPEALPDPPRSGRGAVAAPLQQSHEILVVVTEGGRAAQYRRIQSGQYPVDPSLRIPASDGLGHVEKGAARRRALVRKDDARTRLGGGLRRGQAGRAGPDHQYVAMGMAMVVDVGIGPPGGAAKSRHAPDRRFVQASPEGLRPHECLVVEARNQKTGQKARRRAGIEAQMGPAVDAACREAVMQFHLRRTEIGLGRISPPQLDDGVGFVGARPDHAPRAVVLEAAGEKSHAVGQQGRRERVPRVSRAAASVKGEGKGACAVDPAALAQSERPVHLPLPPPAPPAAGRGPPIG